MAKEGNCDVKTLKGFFETDGAQKVTMSELKDLKGSPSVLGNGDTAYDDIAQGIGNGSFTY